MTGASEGERITVWSVDLRRHPEALRHAATLLSPDEGARARRFQFPELHDNFVLSRGLLRTLLSRSTGIPAAELRFEYNAQGKPGLEGRLSSVIHFNASHSGGMFACAVAFFGPVGADVEYRKPLADYDDVARRFFSTAEVEAVMALPASERRLAFYEYWVRKEAFIKALGGGLSISLQSFRVSIDPQPSRVFVDGEGYAAGWRALPFDPGGQCSGAVVVPDPLEQAQLDVRYADAAHILLGA